MQTQVQIFLHIARVQHGHHACRKQMVGLVRQGGGIRTVVVASHQQNTAVLCCSGMVHVLEHIGTPVDPRAFGVPHGKHAIVFRRTEQRSGLSAPHCSCRQLFIDTWYKFHMVLRQMGLCFPQSLIQSAQR